MNIYTLLLATMPCALSACGDSGGSSNPALGIEAENASGDTNSATSGAKTDNTASVSGAYFALANTFPISVGTETYTTEQSLIYEITRQSRDLLYRALKTNWQVSLVASNLDTMLAEDLVAFDIYKNNEIAESINATRDPTQPRVWKVADALSGDGIAWKTTARVKVKLNDVTSAQAYCAVLEATKDIKPSSGENTLIQDFSISLSEGSCSTINPNRITQLSAKTKIAPGDSKQAVAVVMGISGLNIVSSTVWEWKSYSYFSNGNDPSPCDCKIQFDINGKVQSQTNVPAKYLEATKW